MVVIRDEMVSMANIKSVNFDTLKYANRLKAVGVQDKQAETQAELQAETIVQQADAIYDLSSLINNNLATKQDVNELKQDINELRLATKQDISGLKQDINELRFATKQDIDDLRLDTKQDISELKQDIDKLRLDTKQDISELKLDVTKYIDNCIILSEERTNKNITHMGYKIMVVMVGILGSMIAALGFLIRAN